jgi:hypothetical protein
MASRRAQYETAKKLAKRGIPIAIDLYRRWQQLTPEQRERYLAMAKDYAKKAQETVASQRRGRGERPKRRRSKRGA